MNAYISKTCALNSVYIRVIEPAHSCQCKTEASVRPWWWAWLDELGCALRCEVTGVMSRKQNPSHVNTHFSWSSARKE